MVYVIRTYVGDAGHSPLAGIKVSSLTRRSNVGAILAILASLFGGVVLGPEVALVASGSVVGGLVAKWFKQADPQSEKKIVGFGALGAILALFVGATAVPAPSRWTAARPRSRSINSAGPWSWL